MSDFAARRQALIGRFAEWKVDGLLVSSLTNVRYLTGFTGSSALLLVTAGSATLFTDPRYTLQVQREADCKVRIFKKSLWLSVAPVLKRASIPRLGLESGDVSVRTHAQLRKSLAGAMRLKPLDGVVEKLRMVKSPPEIALIRRSVRINSAAYEAALRRFRPGAKEADLAAELDHQMRLHGAEGTAFETIVATGARSALPHARPEAVTVARDRLLLIDMGARYQGYASDMTRMALPGRPDRRVRKLYRAVLEAQLAAIAAVRAGVKASAVDRAARQSLKEQKLDPLFTHSTGHGLGLDVHEPPSLRRRDKTVLEAGMAITIEPGVYLEGYGGIRIEDTVLVTSNGCEVLTPTSKELRVL